MRMNHKNRIEKVNSYFERRVCAYISLNWKKVSSAMP